MSVQPVTPLCGEAGLLAYLDQHGILYQRIEHPPVYTCEQAERYRLNLPAISTKTLFLRDAHHHFYLAMTACEKQLDLKGLGNQLESLQPGRVKKLQFGSPDEMQSCLGVTPGAVTILGLVNDVHHQVKLLVDTQYWSQDYYLCHPLVNTSTLILTKPELLHFCEITGHLPEPIDMPARQNVA